VPRRETRRGKRRGRLKKLGLLACLVIMCVGLWDGASSIKPNLPVVDGKTLGNGPALLSAGIKAEQAVDNPAKLDHLVSANPDRCYYIQLPKHTTLALYLACGGVFIEEDGGGPYAIWVVPFRVTGTATAAVGTLSGRPEYAALPFGTKLWRPDGYVGVITDGNYGANIESEFSFSLSSPAGVKLLLTIGGWADGAAIFFVFFSLFWISKAPQVDQLRANAQAKAWATWSPVAALAFAPTIRPPTPVLIEHKARSLPAQQPPGSSVPAGAAADADDDAATGLEGTAPNNETEPSITEPSIDVMGPVAHSGWAVGPTRRLVVEVAAYLATHTPRPVPAERLRTALWPYNPGQADVALARVHEQISRLRRCLGPEHLPEAAGGYQLSPTVRCDWASFEAFVEAARAVPQGNSIDFLAKALALVRGQPFADVPAKSYGWAWDEVLVPHMEAAISDAAHTMASRCLAADRATEAAWAARQGLMAVPKDERLLDDLLQAGAAEGRA
jgi:hypothetical protein